MKLIVALLVFGIIVIFHEFGHFIVAKKNGIVEEFAVGMGPKLFGVRRGETEYTLRLLPLGGACMMLGEDTAEEVIPGSFNSKSVWARMAVVAAGPVFNFIMAFVCAVIIIGMNGYISGEILQVEDGSPAMEAGLEAGDIITKADRTSVHTFSDFRMHIALNQGRKCTITYIRDGEKHQTTVTPEMTDDGVYRIGIGDSYESAAKYGLRSVILTIADMILLLSANLGVMNLLPIPALDGGRLVFLIVEALRGKPVPRDKEGFVHMIGFVILMGIMALVMFNDFVRIFGF